MMWASPGSSPWVCLYAVAGGEMKSYERPLTIWGLIWGLLNTLIGVLFALLSASAWSFRDGMLVCKGDRGFAHIFLGKRGFAAMTLGRVVLVVQSLGRATWMHELEHARQAERWGIAYLPAYLLYSLRHGYAKNPFETSAVAVENEFQADHPDTADEPAV